MINKTFYSLILSLLISFSLCAQVESYEEVQSRMFDSKRTNSQWAMNQPYVVMISIDGFRYDYAEKFQAKNILKFVASGVTTPSMYPSFPSKTFPNHYSLVTGLYPANHKIVSNEFYNDVRKESYSIGDIHAKLDGTWYGGTPLWNLAESEGMLSASFFWVGSEANVQGKYPNYFYAYDGSVPNEYRLRQVVDWLKLSPEKRPHALFTYFSLVDDAGHRYGPDSENTREAVLEIDRLFGEFIENLQTLDLPVHVVLVSDHGMSAVSHGVVLPEITDLTGCIVSKSFPPMIYCSDTSKVNKIYNDVKKDGRVQIYKKNEIPEYLHFNQSSLIGDLLLYTEAPTIVLFEPRPVTGGTHGFNPYTNAEMRAFFGAAGPMLKSGYQLPSFENIHVYPLVAHILNLDTPENIDGELYYLKDFLVSPE